ncbi:MAG: PocR ligand-binding domain-containing protein [Lachnospiraceae bacterium]|nr:PocR ligand-binding domain-containing protein [Lachnospiraceae bacterium]
MKHPQLIDLIDVQILQQIQDAFSEFTGMAALITDEEGRPITKGSGFCDFCLHYTRKSEIGNKRCEECDKQGAFLTLNEGKPVVYQCHAGLVDYAVPIIVEDWVIGCFIGGQISTKPIDMMQIRKTAQELGLDEEEYVEAASRITMLGEDKANRAAEFLYTLSKVISSMAYRSNNDLKKSWRLEQAAKSQAAFLIDMNTEFQNNMKAWINSAKQALESGNSEIMEETIRQLWVKGSALLSNLSDTVAYAKMTDGKIVLSETVYNIEKLLQFVCYNVEEQLEDKPIMIIRQIDDNVPSKLLGDQGKIGQILNRLLMNVVEHMDEGVIAIHILSETSGYAEKLTIRIADTEMKIPAETFEQMNHYLKNSSDEVFESKAGDEMNLSMILFLLRQVSGSIELESIEGKENTFVVRLPQLKLA